MTQPPGPDESTGPAQPPEGRPVSPFASPAGGEPGAQQPGQYQGGPAQPGSYPPGPHQGGQPNPYEGGQPGPYQGGQPSPYQPGSFGGAQPGGYPPGSFDGTQPPGQPGQPGQLGPYQPNPYQAGQPGPYQAGQFEPSQQYGAPAGYDPAQPYVLYQATPAGGYGVPVFQQQSGYDPLVSPDYSGWWRRTTAIVKTSWQSLVALQAIGMVVSLALGVPQTLYMLQFQQELQRSQTRLDPDTGAPLPPDLEPLFTIFGLSIAGLFITIMVNFAVTIASTHVGVSAAAGLKPRIGAALGLALKRLFPLIGWQILASLILLVGFCACILPSIYLAAVFLILPAVVTFERGSSAIGRCFALFHKELGSSIARVATIIGISIGAAVIASIIGAVIQTGFGARIFDPNANDPFGGIDSTYMIGVVIASVVVELLTRTAQVFTAPLTLTAYADMRARVEPVTTATLADEIGLAPAAPSQWTA